MAITDFLKKNNIGVGDIAAGANGISSLVQGLSAKKPKPLKATPFKANIRPAQADVEGAMRAKNDIAQSAAGAINDVKKISGSDGKAAVRGILGVQANTNKATGDVEARTSKEYIADMNRVSAETTRAAEINNQNKTRANMVNSAQDQATYNGKIETMNGGIENTANYFIAKDADTKNKAIATKQSDQAVKLGYESSRAQLAAAYSDKYTDPEALDTKLDELMSGHPGFYPRTKKKAISGPVVDGPQPFVPELTNQWSLK